MGRDHAARIHGAFGDDQRVNGRASTIVATATGRGFAECAVVRLSGDRSVEIAEAIFRPNRGESDLAAIAFGTSRGRSVGVGDFSWPLTVHVQRAPRSYTGEDQVEIFSCGAPPIVDALVATLVDHGARMAEGGEFTRRAFENQKIDLVQAEAVAALIAAVDEDERRAARSLLAGDFSERVESIADAALDLLCPIELAIDFSDQDIEIITTENAGEAAIAIATRIDRLIEESGRRRVRIDRPRILLRGKTNAGKSSIFNLLAGQRVAIVADLRGTTRDYLEAEIDLGGRRVLLVDTAGDDFLEDEIDRSAHIVRRREEESADLLVEVVDGRRIIDEAPILRAKDRVVLATHADCVHPSQCPTAIETPSGTVRPIWITSHDPASRASVEGALLAGLAATVGDGAGGWHLNQRTRERLAAARDAIERVRDGLDRNIGIELVAHDLRGVLGALREITGADYDGAVLDSIMRDFCIGK